MDSAVLEQIKAAHVLWRDSGGAEGQRANLADAQLAEAQLDAAIPIVPNLHQRLLADARLAAAMPIPIVPNLHQRLLADLEAGALHLAMARWHGDASCGTTHCRAGAAVHLAGPAGYALEAKVGTAVAGALIHQASCPWLDRVPNFYATDAKALEDIRRCAAREVALAASQGER